MARTREKLGYRLLHRTYRDGDGELRATPKWAVEFRDQRETARRLALFPSKSASDEAARRLVRLVADVQANGRPVSPELLTWAGGLPTRCRRKLAEWGLLPAERVAAGAALAELADGWGAALRARGVSEAQIAQQRHRADRLIRLCGFKRLTDIERKRVAGVLAKLRAGELDGERTLSARTANGHAQALFSLCRWAVREGLLAENPLADGAGRVPVGDEVERDGLALDEQAALVTAAEAGEVWRGISGAQRGLAYRVALATGFRASELAALRVQDLELTADPPTATLPALATKNKRGAVQPLPADLAKLLRARMKGKAPAAPVLTMPHSYDCADMFRHDLDAARRAYVGAEGLPPKQRVEREQSDWCRPERHTGRVLTFHSLRHSYVANLKRAGVPLATAMQLARHSDPRLTAKRYGTLGLRDLRSAVAGLPTFPERQAARATGTDNAAAHCPSHSPEIERFGATSVDSGGRTVDGECVSETPENLGKNAVFPEKSGSRRAGFEPATFGSVDRCSIQLS